MLAGRAARDRSVFEARSPRTGDADSASLHGSDALRIDLECLSMSPQPPIDRRRFLQGAGAAATLPWVTSCAQPGSGTQRPTGVPLGAFDGDSTALEVTEGLNLSGKTVLVTGATSGLGLETMRVLALRGAHVIGTGRTLEKAKAACDSINGRATPVALELERWETVVSASELIRTLGMPIDMLICNAGIMALPKPEQVYGIEKHFVVNHLGHFLLVNRLLDQLKAASQGRVVVVSSLGYQWAPAAGIEFDNLDGMRGYEPNKMYGQSKLANALFSLELARRLREEGSTATSNSVHPGVINTNLGRHFEPWKRTLSKLIGWTFMKSVEAGAATSCYVATAPALAAVSGHYFEDCNPVVPEAGKHMDDLALAARLWQKSTELVGEYLG
jgi:NAD(P)-dependent dehydrogenase (short-subunit alcohol dehydrogenase family)